VSLSSALKPLAQTGTIENKWGGLYFTGTKANVEVFNIDACKLSYSEGILKRTLTFCLQLCPQTLPNSVKLLT
jgi:choice-of-anchor A domain-containing protein